MWIKLKANFESQFLDKYRREVITQKINRQSMQSFFTYFFIVTTDKY